MRTCICARAQAAACVSCARAPPLRHALRARARLASWILIAPRAAVGGGQGSDMAKALFVVLGLALLNADRGSGAGKNRAGGGRGFSFGGPAGQGWR